MNSQDQVGLGMNDSGTGTKTDTPLTHAVRSSFLELPTSRGPILVDSEDEEIVRPFSWYAVPQSGGGDRFYAHARIPKSDKRISMHRLLMKPPPDLVVHHRNNNGLDNRRSNLEITTTRKNIKYVFEGRSTGVHFDTAAQKWRVQVRASLGLYSGEAVARDVSRQIKEKMEEWLAQIEGSAQ